MLNNIFVMTIALFVSQQGLSNPDAYQRQAMKVELTHIANVYKTAYAPTEMNLIFLVEIFFQPFYKTTKERLS